jgi:hypothetical protein
MFVQVHDEEIEGTADLSNLNFTLGGIESGAVLKQGHPHDVPLRFRLPSHEIDFDPWDKPYILRITDVYGARYNLKGELPKEY